MGVRVMFSLGTQDGVLTHFLKAPLEAFLTWHEETAAEFPEDFRAGSRDVLRALVRRGLPALEAADRDCPDVVDDLLTWYYGHFTAIHPASRLEEASGTLLSYWRFQALEDALRQRGLRDAADLLGYLATGRSPLSGAPRHTRLTWEDPVRLAFWTAEEVHCLLALLEALGEEARLSLDEDRGALPAVYEAVTTACERGTGVIIGVG